MIAVLASGQGTNFEVLAQNFPNKISVLICNIENAYVLERAKKHGIPYFLLPHQNFKTRADHEKEIVKILNSFMPLKLVVLAGYMRILTPAFFKEYNLALAPLASMTKPQLINLHPAHLDQFKGADAYAYSVQHSFPRWGLSIHKVTEELDSGDLINSVEFPIFPYESIQDVKKRVQPLEHKLLISTVKNLIEEKDI